MAIAIDDLNNAILSVEREYRCRVRRGRARRLIEYVNMVWGADITQDIREIFSKALLKEGVDLFGWFIYKKLLGRYYNPRSLRSPKRERKVKAAVQEEPEKHKVCAAVELPVDEASVDHVRIQIYSGNVFLTFRAKKPDGRLSWDDIENDPVEAPPNWPGVSKEQWNLQRWRAKKKALAIINSRRRFKSKRKNTKKSKQVALVE